MLELDNAPQWICCTYNENNKTAIMLSDVGKQRKIFFQTIFRVNLVLEKVAKKSKQLEADGICQINTKFKQNLCSDSNSVFYHLSET